MDKHVATARVHNFLRVRKEFLGDEVADQLFIATFQYSSKQEPLTLTQEDLEILLHLAEKGMDHGHQE